MVCTVAIAPAEAKGAKDAGAATLAGGYAAH